MQYRSHEQANSGNTGHPSHPVHTTNQYLTSLQIVQGQFHDHSLIAKRLYSLLCQHFKPTKELSLLDLGCGDASFAASILSQGAS